LDFFGDGRRSRLDGKARGLPGSNDQALLPQFTSECHELLMVVGQLLITPTAIEICIYQLGRVEEMV